ncbi:MAG: ATP-binding protein [Legionella sp.]|nr:ATP-binding protein [Legionella sp.]
MPNLIHTLIAEFHAKIKHPPKLLERKQRLVQVDNKITVAIGMRRVGKTTCIFQKILSLLSKKQTSLEQILYLNLEDDRLIPFSAKQLAELIESFYTLYPKNHDRLCYLFLDEIQNIPDWPLLIRRLFDTKTVEIYLSGSSAKLLSKEIHTSLRGRAFSQEVWPFDFVEYFHATKQPLTEKLFSQKAHDQLFVLLKQYLEQGGFPETLNMTIEQRRQTLQDYVDVVVMRDIIERHGITNVSLIKYMIKSLLKNASTGFSVNKFHNDLKSQGFSTAKNTLYDYLNYIQDAYLIFTVPLYSESIRKTQTNPRKIYAIDTGLVKAYSFGITKNLGHYFENMFYLDLKRQGYEVYYYLTKERYEIDFMAIDSKGTPKLFQIVWDISDSKTLEREQRALVSAEQELGIKGTLITPTVYFENNWNAFI